MAPRGRQLLLGLKVAHSEENQTAVFDARKAHAPETTRAKPPVSSATTLWSVDRDTRTPLGKTTNVPAGRLRTIRELREEVWLATEHGVGRELDQQGDVVHGASGDP